MVDEMKEMGEQEDEGYREPDENNKRTKEGGGGSEQWNKVHEAVVRLEQLEESFSGASPGIDSQEEQEANEQEEGEEEQKSGKVHYKEMYATI